MVIPYYRFCRHLGQAGLPVVGPPDVFRNERVTSIFLYCIGAWMSVSSCFVVRFSPVETAGLVSPVVLPRGPVWPYF